MHDAVRVRGRRLRLACLLAYVATGLAACRPAVMVVPPHVHSVGVATFENRTTEFSLDTLLTNETLRQFQIDGRLPLENPDRADLVVRAVIRGYSREPIQYDPATNYVLQYRLTVTYDLVAFDRQENRSLVEQKDLARSVFYYTEQAAGAVTETLDQARQRLAEEVGRSTVRKVLEGF